MKKANVCLIAAMLFFTLANAGTVLALVFPGILEGSGTHFEITDSTYLNVSLDSSEPIKVMLESAPEMVTMHIEPISETPSTIITISGFVPLTTYYKYEDNYHNLVEFTTDETGDYTYTQDLSQKHLVFIQSSQSTLFIDDNATGGDCTLIGTWDSGSKTCTLTGDVYDSVQIDSDGITLDGGGYTINVHTSAYGVFSNGMTEITIRNLNAENNHAGINLDYCSNSTIADNTVSNNYHGIQLRFSENNTVVGNTANSNISGITIFLDSNNTLVKNNTLLSNIVGGVSIMSQSNNNTVVNNDFIDNEDYQAYVSGSTGNIFNLPKPTGGNYWNDANLTDNDNDGFADNPYIFTGGQDNLPLVEPFSPGPGPEDTTPPVTAIALSGTEGDNGWYVSDVEVTLSATDDSSGVASTEYSLDGTNWGTYTAPFTIASEGTTTVYYRSTDGSGNVEATKSQTIKIDKTAPSITGSKTPEPNANGWNNTDIVVSFTCNDTASGIETCTTDKIITNEGAGQSVTGTATDLAGNTTTITVDEINMDKTSPSIVGNKTPEPNANGWNNTDVTVQFTCTDALSGINTCTPETVTIETEGTEQSATSTATDQAGNTATATVNEINIDKTLATTAITLSGIKGNNEWYVSDVEVTLSATDDSSGIASTEYSFDETNWNAYTEPFTISDEGEKTVYYKSTDIAGNIETTESKTLKIDKTTPSITGSRTPPANANGWNNTDVTVQFTCTDELSEIDTCTPDTTLTTEGENQSTTGTATDKAGNTTSATVTNINIDKTAPAIAGSKTPTPNANGWNNTDVTVEFQCEDNLSGIDSCGPDALISAEGTGQSVTGTATDMAGNTTTTTVSEINIDKTAPAITITTPTSYGLYAVGVALDFTATDSESGLAYVTGELTNTIGTTVEVQSGFAPAPGVYTLIVEAADVAGNTAESDSVYFVVYDPEGGFATGGGWFHPDAESSLAPEGRANFGFVAKYKKGISTGNLEFKYKDAGINLKSATIDWLVISGVSAQFQGTGTINGEGLYTFRVQVKDNGEPGADTDSFDIKIWKGTKTEADPVYRAKNTLAGGNIVIHKKK